MSRTEQNAGVRALERAFGARARVDADHLENYAWDYGLMVCRKPVVVVVVQSVEELLTALRIASEHKLPICARGSGHSLSGQCLAEGALVLDMKALAGVQLEAERGSGWLSGGATWHQVANAAFAEGFMPVGLTMIVDTTVGGTLSVGGLGCESFVTGAQADQVLELDVATLDGNIVRCSSEQHRELFDAMRAGLGQCGIIVQARYPLRKAKAHVRTHTLAYADGGTLLTDMQTVAQQARCDFMFGGLLWSEQSGWQLLLLLGREFDQESELNDSTVLSGLQFTRELARTDSVQWRSDGSPGHRFFRLVEDHNPDALHHPWIDSLCEPRAAAQLLSAVLSEPAVAPRGGTFGSLHLIAAHPNRAPLIQPDSSGPLIILGMFPEASDAQLPAALAYMRRHNQQRLALGGKRYLSGYIENWGPDDWSAQFGETWPWFCAQKQRFDPQGLLNKDCIRWR